MSPGYYETHSLSGPSDTQTRRVVLRRLGNDVKVNVIDFLVCPSTIVLQQVVVLSSLERKYG